MEKLFKAMYDRMQSIAGELSNTLFNALQEDLLQVMQNEQTDPLTRSQAKLVYDRLEEIQRRFFPYEGDAYDFMFEFFKLQEKTFLREGPKFVEYRYVEDYIEQIDVKNVSTGETYSVYVVYELHYDEESKVHRMIDESFHHQGIAYWGVPMEAEAGYMLDEVTQIV
jgi:hypothetical protein